VLLSAALFDLFMVGQIHSHGWPPVGLGETSAIDNAVLVPTATTTDFILFTLFIVFIALVHVLLVKLAWRLWRTPKT
jgi:hypothetical protein